jgi:hypothetical protein
MKHFKHLLPVLFFYNNRCKCAKDIEQRKVKDYVLNLLKPELILLKYFITHESYFI